MSLSRVVSTRRTNSVLNVMTRPQKYYHEMMHVGIAFSSTKIPFGINLIFSPADKAPKVPATYIYLPTVSMYTVLPIPLTNIKMEILQPKTFQCSLCSASFTRSTHLSRHLHTHTSERAHRCIACFSEFSRSDVLNRHTKTCKAINNQIAETVRHSRQKSCQACVQAKAKCDLQEPCSKCISRGKE
ncbi:hypothetical protein EV421DRAFT_1041379 [Armillaria borealis]|uniref:C2H2-type domain-containing protein n=1 Tax=Armillaria borealis TaxID=47425 RepID=A0AA39MYN9_9AGAR|nr:hypothetical protein EV421DRAFT_1041379 [Armillaria borealis]